MNHRKKTLSLATAFFILTAGPPPRAAETEGPTTRQMNLMTWTEFREWVPSRIQTVLLPVGSLEAHGVIPSGSDSIAPTAMAEVIAPRLNAMIAPTVRYGVTPTLQAYPGAISVSPTALKGYVTDILKELGRNGFVNVIVLNGHGGNTDVLREVAREVSPQTQTRIVILNWWGLAEQETLDVFGDPGGHAGSNETAYLQAIVPEHVHPERYSKEMAAPNPPAGAVYVIPSPASIGLYRADEGYPTFDPDQAAVYFKKVNDRVASVIEEILAGWARAGLYE